MEILTYKEAFEKGLIYKINKEVLHPLGLALPNVGYTDLLVSPDGVWSYVPEVEDEERRKLEANFAPKIPTHSFCTCSERTSVRSDVDGSTVCVSCGGFIVPPSTTIIPDTHGFVGGGVCEPKAHNTPPPIVDCAYCICPKGTRRYTVIKGRRVCCTCGKEMVDE